MILDILVEATKKRIEARKQEVSLKELKSKIYIENNIRKFHQREAFAFEKALKEDKISFICEVKKASPSKGIIAEDFPYLQIAKDYETAGASAISVLTEPEYFKGSDGYLQEISKEVNVPVLRKDFVIDEYMIYEAKILGADAVLLIAGILSQETLKNYLNLCNELGLSALVEAHTEEETKKAVLAGSRVIGVNNRDLKTFEVDLNHCIILRKKVPESILFVAESGIQSPEDIVRIKEAGIHGVLIGETLMRSSDKKKTLESLRGDSYE